MGSHPLNLFLRFLLEMVALLSAGIWGWNQSTGLKQYFLAAIIPIILATIWGVFAVPNDPSRSGKSPIVTPGKIRLIIELLIFAIAAWALNDLKLHKTSLAFIIVIFLHYISSYDRIKWLLNAGK